MSQHMPMTKGSLLLTSSLIPLFLYILLLQVQQGVKEPRVQGKVMLAIELPRGFRPAAEGRFD